VRIAFNKRGPPHKIVSNPKMIDAEQHARLRRPAAGFAHMLH
jgi:hypothetical protein